MEKIYSPDHSLSVYVEPEEKNIGITLQKNGRTIVQVDFSLHSGNGDFDRFALPGYETRRNFQEDYVLPAGKLEKYTQAGEEALLNLGRVSVRFRACRDGFAFRYELSGKGNTEISEEKTVFSFLDSADTIFAQELFSTYERPYLRRKWADTLNQPYGMPILLEDGGIWMLISEASLWSESLFCSSHLVGGGEERKLSLCFAPEEMGKPIPVELPFVSPWRMITVSENLSDLVRTHLNDDLCRETSLQDLSWIRPARALWAWWEYENGAQLYSESRHYVDTAAELGFEALTLDCGWDAEWVPSLCKYAHEKHVQLWLWTDRHRVDTPEKMEKWLPLWASWNIDGLKIDFFENDSKETMEAYRMLLERAAELRLMINFHGATKPAGDRRTWPNMMTSEGIMGIEHYKWSDMPNAEHNCTVPFTRNVLGPMDYTPVGYSNMNRNTTHAHQLALSVVFESGVTHYALSVYHLEAWEGTEFLRHTFAKYEDMKLLTGFPGNDVAIMRRRENEYLIGAITVHKQMMHLPLVFLSDGVYRAEIFEDSEKDEMILRRTEDVTKNSVLSLPLMEHGGAAIRIYVPGSDETEKTDMVTVSSAVPIGGSELMSFPDSEKGLLLYDSMKLDIPDQEFDTMRMIYTSVGSCRLRVETEAQDIEFDLPAGKSSFDRIAYDIPLNIKKGQVNKMKLTRLSGDVPALIAFRFVNRFTPAWRIYEADQAELTGNAVLTKSVTGHTEAVRLGFDAEMIFSNVEVHEEGKYLLSIRYCGGESRNISVCINDDMVIRTYLHSTAGWGFPTWKNAENKEYLVQMKKGRNSIRLYQKDGMMSHIRSIAISTVPVTES